ncbi:cysteine hydrolase family protein [Ancylobacter defluvii]|uniref:Cysteine hydrolase n=1 Tax=Ancylobacter defluvii TaxID=1282440 RepID=A0A9W6JYL7_9HYPH|nr:isochorismatase family cysteine hydrolase [Ancylobacter defluvii]MBS7589122.1 cysteine hydrolase [Ancylobacter defluvii]GLK84734.1 cysteine hydrolase [Ancylobacter defluvii]
MPSVAARPYDWPHGRDLVPATTALIVIDMQRDFCEPGGYVDAMGYDVGPAQALIPRIAALREAVRGFGGLVVYTREGHRPDLSDLTPQKRFRSRAAGAEIGSQGPLGRLLIRGEPGWDIVPALAPAPGEPVIDKPGFSAFYATDLDRILVARGTRHLVICGVTTDICVHSTLREAVDRGYEPLLVTDGCAATVEANHHAAIDTICTEGGIFGAVAESAAVIAALRG